MTGKKTIKGVMRLVQMPKRKGDRRPAKGKSLIPCGERSKMSIDGGMTKQMIYHGRHGWSLDKKN